MIKYVLLFAILGLADSPKRNAPPDNAPSDLWMESPLDFVFRESRDFRELYCSPNIIQTRIRDKKCVLNVMEPQKVIEIQVEPGEDLQAVLQRTGRKRLINWNGRTPMLTVIKRTAILRNNESNPLIKTIIEPGDFIVVKPTE